MEIGTLVKVNIPYKLGERRNGERYKEGKIIAIYRNFILVEFKKGYRECYRPEEIQIISSEV